MMQGKVLDDFEDLSGWKVFASGTAELRSSPDRGVSGPALRLDFDFHGGGGFVVARKEFPLEIPESYSFGFRIRGSGPRNHFEFKLVDGSNRNVWRYRVEDFALPEAWQFLRIRDSQVEFAWGPLGGGAPRNIAAIELVIAAGPGGRGWVSFEQLRFQDDTYRATPLVSASSALSGHDPLNVTMLSDPSSWRSEPEDEPHWLLIDFRQEREFGGLVIHWEEQLRGRQFEVEVSVDGEAWKTAWATSQGGSDRSYLYLPRTLARYVRLRLGRSTGGLGFGIRGIEVKPYDFSRSLNHFFQSVARDHPAGLFPKYLAGRQTCWTVVGTGRGDGVALLNEEGMVEVDKGSFSIAPFLYTAGRLVTWADVELEQELAGGYLPIPSVTWRTGSLTMKVTAFAAGEPGRPVLTLRYCLENTAAERQAVTLFAAILPFQVTPTWQNWRSFGGVAPVRELYFVGPEGGTADPGGPGGFGSVRASSFVGMGAGPAHSQGAAGFGCVGGASFVVPEGGTADPGGPGGFGSVRASSFVGMEAGPAHPEGAAGFSPARDLVLGKPDSAAAGTGGPPVAGAARRSSPGWGGVVVNGNKVVIPLTPASGFGAAAFAEGGVAEYLSRGTLPNRSEVRDEFGYASGALRFDLELAPGSSEEVVLAVPFGPAGPGSPAPFGPLEREAVGPVSAGLKFTGGADSEGLLAGLPEGLPGGAVRAAIEFDAEVPIEAGTKGRGMAAPSVQDRAEAEDAKALPGVEGSPGAGAARGPVDRTEEVSWHQACFVTPATLAGPGLPGTSVSGLLDSAVRHWESVLDAVEIRLPPRAQGIVDTFRTAAAHILINRDGPALHPGPRRYSRSWIRDGALMGAALLRLGCTEPLRDFLRWYRGYQAEDGSLPDCVDWEGTEWLPEFDAYGQFLYGVMEHYRYTADRAFLEEMRPAAAKTLAFLEGLRRRRLTDEYRTPEKRACYGLLPESMSHEGYMAHPVHAYWDDFWALRGFGDAAAMASVLGDRAEAARLARLRDIFSEDLGASLRAAISRHAIDYVPGSVEFGDFDPSATSIAVGLLDQLPLLPRPEIDLTFDKYLAGFRERAAYAIDWNNYSAYEVRIVGALVRMGRRRDALDLLTFLLSDRRIPAWNQWPEISWRDPSSPSFIGDLPHTWISGEYILAVRSLFACEREADESLVIAAGVDPNWLANGFEVGVRNLPTYYGNLSYRLRLEDAGALRPEEAGTLRRKEPGVLTLTLEGGLRMPPGGIVVEPPLAGPVRRVEVNGRPLAEFTAGSFTCRECPAEARVKV